MSTTENLRLTTAKFNFDDTGVAVEAYPDEGAEICAFYLHVALIFLDDQISSMEQIFDALGSAFSGVERLALVVKTTVLRARLIDINFLKWRRLLRAFRNVKTLLIEGEFVGELSSCFESGDGRFVLELLPKLKELSYYSLGCDAGERFTGFINARRVAGRPVTFVCR